MSSQVQIPDEYEFTSPKDQAYSHYLVLHNFVVIHLKSSEYTSVKVSEYENDLQPAKYMAFYLLGIWIYIRKRLSYPSSRQLKLLQKTYAEKSWSRQGRTMPKL